MMTSSNGNIFRVTGPLCGEFTGPGEFPTQRPVTRSFDVYFDLRLNKRLCKQSWGWWFETLLCPLWRHSTVKSQPPRRLLFGVSWQKTLTTQNTKQESLLGFYMWSKLASLQSQTLNCLSMLWTTRQNKKLLEIIHFICLWIHSYTPGPEKMWSNSRRRRLWWWWWWRW